MNRTFILCGPQAVGKTRRAESIASALKCQFIQDDWNGRDPLRAGTLAITNAEYTMPEGGVAFHIEDEAGLKNLLLMLGGDPDNCTNRVRLPYQRQSVSACSIEARNLLSSKMSESNWSACSGCALFPNTLLTANHAGSSVSAAITTESTTCSGTEDLSLSTTSSHFDSAASAFDSSIPLTSE